MPGQQSRAPGCSQPTNQGYPVCTLTDILINPGMSQAPVTPKCSPQRALAVQRIDWMLGIAASGLEDRVKTIALPIENRVGNLIGASQRGPNVRNGLGVGAVSKPGRASPSFAQCRPWGSWRRRRGAGECFSQRLDFSAYACNIHKYGMFIRQLPTLIIRNENLQLCNFSTIEDYITWGGLV
eukprot:354639-Chlamydomonas_euryale.AAC.2